MKKKVLVGAAIAAAVLASGGMLACHDVSRDDPGSGGGHTHSYSERTVSATCVTGGYVLHECACGESYRTDETAALGHDYSAHDPLDDEYCYVSCSRGDSDLTDEAEEHVMRQDGIGIKCELCDYYAGAIESLTYELDSDDSGYVVTGIEDDSACAVIPETYNGKPVVGIGEGALAYQPGRGWIRNIVLPSSLEFIEKGALSNFRANRVFFRGTVEQWLEVDIPSEMDNPFYHILSDEVWIDGKLANELVIPDGVTEIKKYAFAGCRGLTSVSLPASLVKIGARAFYDCGNVKTINLPAGLETMDKTAFDNCVFDTITTQSSKFVIKNDCLIDVQSKTLLRALNSDSVIPADGSVEVIGSNAFAERAVTEVVIPDSVTTVEASAFSYCTALSKLTIGEGVTTIGMWAFEYCTALKKVTIPGTVTKVDNGAFCNCYTLASVTIENGIKKTAFSNGTMMMPMRYVFYGCSSLFEVYNLTGITPSSSDKSSSWGYLFKNAKDIYTSRSDASKLTATADGFDYYDSDEPVLLGYSGKRTEIVLPDKLGGKDYSIAAGAFYGNASLASVSIPDSVTAIGVEAFYECTALKSITVGANVTTIESRTFYGCAALESIELSGVTKIGDHAFDGCVKVKTVKIPNVVELGEGAFYGCEALTKIEMPKAETIGKNAFYGCVELKNVDLPSVVTIKNSAFYGCRALTTVKLGSGVESIGDHAFYDTSVDDLILPASLVSVGDGIIQRATRPDKMPDVWCEAAEQADDYCEDWDLVYDEDYATVHWGTTWEMKDGKPTPKA